MGNQFRSKATLLINPPVAAVEKTVVVLGAFRGGTSMIAQILRDFGVFMGETFAQVDDEYDTVEDQEFQDLLHRRELLTQPTVTAADFSPREMEALRALIHRRNAAHRLWGWKYPGTVIWCLHAGLTNCLRNPHFITVFRDPLAIFQHEADKHRRGIDELRGQGRRSLAWPALQAQRLVEHVQRADAPHLLVSYERMTTGGEAGVAELRQAISELLCPALE